MIDALGLIEITGLSPAMVALDVMDKAATIRLVQVELNDRLGALIKITGDPAADYMPGQWGSADGATGYPGSIWKIDGVTGEVTVTAAGIVATFSGSPAGFW